MKRIVIFALSMLIVSALCLSGCTDPKIQDDIKELKYQVSVLEKTVLGLIQTKQTQPKILSSGDYSETGALAGTHFKGSVTVAMREKDDPYLKIGEDLEDATEVTSLRLGFASDATTTDSIVIWADPQDGTLKAILSSEAFENGDLKDASVLRNLSKTLAYQ